MTLYEATRRGELTRSIQPHRWGRADAASEAPWADGPSESWGHRTEAVATSALVTGGVGPWLPFQMLGAAWVGLGAGLLPPAKGRAEIVLLAGEAGTDALEPALERARVLSGSVDLVRDLAPDVVLLDLVMAGMGFDAAIMGNTSEQLKARVGWSAYFVTGIKSIFIQRFRVRWSIDGREQRPVLARTILFGNCGTLTGGIQLIPSARLDDGLVDGIVVAPKTLVGWGSIAVRVLGRSDKAGQELIRTSGAEYTAVVDEPHPVQVDGDVIGEASRLRVTVDRQALVVRVSGV